MPKSVLIVLAVATVFAAAPASFVAGWRRMRSTRVSPRRTSSS